jgi:hypothetical protein
MDNGGVVHESKRRWGVLEVSHISATCVGPFLEVCKGIQRMIRGQGNMAWRIPTCCHLSHFSPPISIIFKSIGKKKHTVHF